MFQPDKDPAPCAPLRQATRQTRTVLQAPGSLASALRNLVENAVFHSPRRAQVTVRVGEDGLVSVIVHGQGLTSVSRERMFDRFWRPADSPRNGAGLGLAIVAAVAKAHGGHVSVEDTPGGGATFVFHLVRIIHPGDGKTEE